MDKWRRCNLCRGGRITLCKSVLSSLPTYYMSVFLMPESALKLFGKNHRKFFGEGNKGGMLNHLVKWDAVIKSYKDGKLSLGKLKNKNLALLSKWGSRFSIEQNSLWCQVIRSIHGSSTFNWHSSGKETVSLRSPWISISRQWRKIDSLNLFKLGDGSRILFWKHPSMDRITLECKFLIVGTLLPALGPFISKDCSTMRKY